MSDGRINNKGTKGNSGGSPGYGSLDLVKENVKKYCPLWWEEWENMIKSDKAENKRFAMAEFNKLQAKMIPQDLTSGGDKIIIPIYNGQSISKHKGDQEDIQSDKENKGDSGRNISK